jgi:hypothetical protein
VALGFDYDKEIHAQDAVAHEVERTVDTFNAFMRGNGEVLKSWSPRKKPSRRSAQTRLG